MANGELEITVPGLERQDEIGDIAHSVEGISDIGKKAL